jgi:hypothetical protein
MMNLIFVISPSFVQVTRVRGFPLQVTTISDNLILCKQQWQRVLLLGDNKEYGQDYGEARTSEFGHQ